MARRRIKTLAKTWNVSVADVMQSCARLNLVKVLSESSLLGPAEAERVKADLDHEAHRASVLNRETVVESRGGKVVEKRLNATVMRRRHSVPSEAATAPAQPFQFHTPESRQPFAAPVFEQVEPAAVEVPAFPETAVELPPEVAPEAPADQGAAEDEISEPTPAGPQAAPSAGAEPGAEQREAEPEVPRVELPPSPAEAPGVEMSGNGHAAAAEVPEAPAAPSVVDLTRAEHAAAPPIETVQQRPRVLGKIDLRPPAPPRPASGPARAPSAGRIEPSREGPPPGGMGGEMPTGRGKPGARPLRKRKVIKKGGHDFAAERERRGLRVPRKRRALPGKEQRKTELTTPKASKRVVRIAEGVTVGDLARTMGVKGAELVKKLMELGQMATLNQLLDVDTATLVAGEFGYTVENVAFDIESEIEDLEEEQAGELLPRPPVVTVMGHVDHGKTSLLDSIRHTSVTAGESGGITQHIGAYTVDMDGRRIAFVDTPGHEAFTAMRARGAQVTDIVVLVVAATDGVMPQTIEAINHARAAKVPIIVALNKIDLAQANPDRVKQQLAEQGLIPEDYGGDTITLPVSAKTGEGIDRLLEMILLQADLMELRADPRRSARGVVIESRLDRGRGPLATVLIQEGTLHERDAFVCGVSHGRVRAMLDHAGRRLKEAGPSIPVEVFGLSTVPEPGTTFSAVAKESKARQVAEFRRSRQREAELQKTSRVSLEDLKTRMTAGEVKDLNVVLKGDVQGSVEALGDALTRLSTEEVKLNVIHASVGAVSETDVSLATASDALIVGFNVRPDAKALAMAEREGVTIRLYKVIYEAIDEIREAMEGLLAPTFREQEVGRAEVRQIFSVPGGTVAGSMVLSGRITRGCRARLTRDGRVAWEGRIGSLRRFKDDAREVQAGYECGIRLENYNDLKPGDVIEAFEMEAVERKLESPGPEPLAARVTAEKQLQT